jgi:hypothetical protein
MKAKIVYFWETDDRGPEPVHQETVEVLNLDEAIARGDRVIRDSQIAQIIPSGVPATFIVCEKGKVAYPQSPG